MQGLRARRRTTNVLAAARADPTSGYSRTEPLTLLSSSQKSSEAHGPTSGATTSMRHCAAALLLHVKEPCGVEARETPGMEGGCCTKQSPNGASIRRATAVLHRPARGGSRGTRPSIRCNSGVSVPPLRMQPVGRYLCNSLEVSGRPGVDRPRGASPCPFGVRLSHKCPEMRTTSELWEAGR